MLLEYAIAPKLYLDERGKVKIDDVGRALWRRLEATFDENWELRLQYQAMRLGDNFADGPVTADDLQNDLFAASEVPF